MATYSLDLRQRVVEAVKGKEDRFKTRVAKRFKVSRTTVYRYLKLDAEGALKPKRRKPYRSKKFTTEYSTP